MRQTFLLAASLLIGGTCAAFAQSSPFGYGPRNMPSVPQKSNTPPVPPALPGARTNNAPAADPSKLATDMAPNEALFDAINRGDLGAARDALNRGAMLSATNVLGLTPLDLSIDLGRDDITFLLLSMRGGEPDPTGAAHTVTTGRGPHPARGAASASAGASGVSGAASAARNGPGPRPQAAARAQPAARPTPPARYADEVGTLNPAAGFLGFGGK